MAETNSRTARDVFGVFPDGRVVERVVLRGENGFEARIITFGAAIQALIVPDAAGHCDDIGSSVRPAFRPENCFGESL